MLTKEYKIAKYLTLSNKDNKNYESESISNQREFIRNFINNSDKLKNSTIVEYIDDGYSGSNTDRPMFRQMINDIGNGLINCIIVKDLSRLGRNYIDVGGFVKISLKVNFKYIINKSFIEVFCRLCFILYLLLID